MAIAYYFSYTQVRVDNDRPTAEWTLSDEGRARVLGILRAPWLARVGRIVTPDEARAVETADIFARRLRVPVEIDTGLRDVRRLPYEYLPVIEFERALDGFFAHPDESVLPGWETARAAQIRLMAAFEAQIAQQDERSDVLFIGHGAAGTLLQCGLGNLPLSRDFFESPRGGNLFGVDCKSRALLFRWRSVAAPR